jgi:membrane-associated protein
MEYRTFLFYNIFGGVLWSTLLIFLGYALGALIPSIDRYLLPIVLAIIFFSFLPIVWEWMKNRNKQL